MANLLQPKQIKKPLIGRMGITGFTAAGTSNVVTTELTAAATADGVPVQVGTSSTEGFITTGTNNKALIVDATSKAAIEIDGNEVYGRITEAAAVYTLSYYTLVSGVETAATLAQDIDFFPAYNYDLKNLPNDVLIRVRATSVGEDPSSQSGRPIRNEKLTVTGTNTFASPTLAYTPIDNSVAIYINGKAETEGASEAFTRSGKDLTWDATDAKYDLETTDDVVVHYNTLETV